MAIINFTKADVLRAQNLENEKWYSWEVASCTGPTPNKNKDGVNFLVSFKLIDASDELNGKEVNRIYSSKAISMFIPLVAACKGMTQDSMPKESFQFDTDEIVGKKVDGKYTLELYEGQLQGRVESYLPYKSAAGQGPQF